MFVFSFSVPGEVNDRYVQASSVEEAEHIAVLACRNHYFCGGPVCPPVCLVGEILPNKKIKLIDGRVVRDTF